MRGLIVLTIAQLIYIWKVSYLEMFPFVFLQNRKYVDCIGDCHRCYDDVIGMECTDRNIT